MGKPFVKDTIRKQFIEAAKVLLLKEGVENVSVRKIGNMCNCSYATIYNYFDNLDHLLFYVAVDFLKEISLIRCKDSKKESYQIQDLSQLLRDYVKFYIKNPNVFRFFFYYQLEISPYRSAEAQEQGCEQERPHLEEELRNILENMEDKQIFRKETIPEISTVLVHSVHGLLMMYFSKRREMTEEDVFLELERIVIFSAKNHM